MGNNKQHLLMAENLSVSYGGITALESVNLEVNEGEFVTIIGPNGAGKSTLIKALVGVLNVRSGSVWFRGRNITRKPTDAIIASGISIVPEGRGVLTSMTVLENLQLGAYHIKGDLSTRFEWVFEHFPVLAERKNQEAGTLSGGEQQMLVIGRALMGKPKLLVLDEPSLGLAPVLVTDLFQTLIELKNEGQTILLSEQNAVKALECADRAYVFKQGRVALEGVVEVIVDNPIIREVYLGLTV